MLRFICHSVPPIRSGKQPNPQNRVESTATQNLLLFEYNLFVLPCLPSWHAGHYISFMFFRIKKVLVIYVQFQVKFIMIFWQIPRRWLWIPKRWMTKPTLQFVTCQTWHNPKTMLNAKGLQGDWIQNTVSCTSVREIQIMCWRFLISD